MRAVPLHVEQRHAALAHQANEFNERILEHMSSGVVTIGADERVSTLNRRGAQILELDPRATGVPSTKGTLTE